MGGQGWLVEFGLGRILVASDHSRNSRWKEVPVEVGVSRWLGGALGRTPLNFLRII